MGTLDKKDTCSLAPAAPTPSFRTTDDTIDMIDRSESNPQLLLAPYRLNPDCSIWTVSVQPMTMVKRDDFGDHGRDNLSSPQKFSTYPVRNHIRQAACLVPKGPYHSAFALGWSKLPAEIEKHIPQHNLFFGYVGILQRK